MKVVTVVYEDIDYDPRASKFRDVLKEKYDVVTLSTSYDERVVIGSTQKIRLKKGHKYRNWFIFSYLVILRIKSIKPDVILSHNYATALSCWLASKFLGVPLAYDAYEFYTPQRGFSLSKRDYFFFFMEKFVIKRANLVFSANIERSRLMKSGFKLSCLPVPILNIPSYSIVSKGNKTIDKGGKVVVVYEGFISFTRFVDILIDSLSYLPEYFTLLIIGDGPDVDRMKALIASKSFKERINYIGRINREEVIPTLSTCDIGFVGYPFTDLNNRYCSPNKIFEYPASGIPFVSSCQSTILELTKKYKICSFYNPLKGGAQSIADAILTIASDYGEYTQGLSSFIQENSWDKERAKIQNSFNKEFER